MTWDKRVNFNRGNTYQLSELSDSGQRTVLETRRLMADLQKRLRESTVQSGGMGVVVFSRAGHRKPVLQHAKKKASMRGWLWWEDDQKDEVHVLGG